MINDHKIAYSPEELSKVLSISIPTLARDRANGNSGGIPYVQVGGKILYPRHLIENWLTRKAINGLQEKDKVSQLETIKRKRGRPKGTTKVYLNKLN